MQQVLNEIIMCPVLMYTSIIPSDSENTSFCTTIQKFETDMTTLIAKGYNPISIREAYECRKNEKEWRKNPVCVVFLGRLLSILCKPLKWYRIEISFWRLKICQGTKTARRYGQRKKREKKNYENFCLCLMWRT